jgi:hypothetical protein
VKARRVFIAHGGMLRSSKAIRFGIIRARYTRFGTPRRSNGLGVVCTACAALRRFPIRIWCQSRFEVRAQWSA